MSSRTGRWVRRVSSAACMALLTVTVGGGAGPVARADSAPAVHYAPSSLPGAKPKGVLPHPRSVTPQPGATSAAVSMHPAFETGGGCTATIGLPSSSVGQDGYLEETAGVSFQSSLSCDVLVNYAAAAFLIDRSPDFNGQTFDGNDISDGTVVQSDGSPDSGFTATSTGSFGSDARTYDGARAVESAFDVIVQLVDGSVWGDCTADPGVEILFCDGVGTDTLEVVYGSGDMQTGMTPACRDFSISGDAEQARFSTVDPGTGAPYAIALLGNVPAVQQQLIAFRKAMCGLTGTVTGFAQQRGMTLWTTAVAQAKNGTGRGDDRPLYWARLGMQLAMAQWTPAPADIATARVELEKASRGMESANFTTSLRRTLISGFDPFGLDPAHFSGGDIHGANPSGQAVLRLDGTVIGQTEVHAVVFPVRYADFDSRLVENFFKPYLSPTSAQRVNLVVTVSRGGANQFNLEFYNGRNRSTGGGGGCSSTGPFQDNLNQDTTGTCQMPAEPNVDAGAQFTQTTLPVAAIAAANPTLAAVNYRVVEIRKTAQVPQPPSASATGPHVSSMAVEGSGGGYLSNEIAYRVTRLRDALGSTVEAGHIHTPLITGVDPVTAGQFETLLRSAALASPPVPVRVMPGKSSYNVGDSPTYVVSGPPNTPVLWSSSLNGVETSEIDADYGQSTDASGSLTVSFSPWTSSQVGSWVKQIRMGSVIATVAFQVQAATPTPPPSFVWQPGAVFASGATFNGGNGVLAMQSDGNLVLYSLSGVPLWSSGTVNHPGAEAVYEFSGNLVIYDTPTDAPIWSSGATSVQPGRLEFQSDGNLVLFDASGNQTWATNTYGDPPQSIPPAFDFTFHANKTFVPGESYTANKDTLAMQSDGNLAIYSLSGALLWSTGTSGHPGAHAVYQADGNLVVYDTGGSPLWASGSSSAGGGRLLLQGDGDLVVYDSAGTPRWASGTVPS